MGNTLRLYCDIITYVSPHGTEGSEGGFCLSPLIQVLRTPVQNLIGWGRVFTVSPHGVDCNEDSDLRHFEGQSGEHSQALL